MKDNDKEVDGEYPDIMGPCIVRRISGGKTLIMMKVDSELIDVKHDEMWIARLHLPPKEFRKKLPKESLNYRHDHLLTIKYDWYNLEKTFSRYDDED